VHRRIHGEILYLAPRRPTSVATVGGDISAYLASYGYQAYANRNVQVYLDVLRSISEGTVLALSSGFMTYRADTHPAYRGISREVIASRSTVVLLPEQVIRERFGVYWALPTKKLETSRPIDAVVDDLVTHLPGARGG
jgi:hypothetical protein